MLGFSRPSLFKLSWDFICSVFNLRNISNFIKRKKYKIEYFEKLKDFTEIPNFFIHATLTWKEIDRIKIEKQSQIKINFIIIDRKIYCKGQHSIGRIV